MPVPPGHADAAAVDQLGRPGGDRHGPRRRARRLHRRDRARADRPSRGRRARTAGAARFAINLTPFSLLDPAFDAAALDAQVRGPGLEPAPDHDRVHRAAVRPRHPRAPSPCQGPAQGRLRVRGRRRRRRLRELLADRRPAPIGHQDRPRDRPRHRSRRRQAGPRRGLRVVRPADRRAPAGGGHRAARRRHRAHGAQRRVRPGLPARAGPRSTPMPPRRLDRVGRAAEAKRKTRASVARLARQDPTPPTPARAALAYHRGHDRALSRVRFPDHIRAYLDDTRLRDDLHGRPRRRPASGGHLVHIDGDEIVLNSRIGRRWPTNLLRDPRIAIAVIDADRRRALGRRHGRGPLGPHDWATSQGDIAAMARRYPGREPEEVERTIAENSSARTGSASGSRRSRSTTTCRRMTRFGLQLWAQQTDWPGFRDSALAAEDAGWDSVWTWDHLMAIFGPWEQPIFEGWSVAGGPRPITSRVRLGLMVGANTFRNPGHTAKLATTLDHLSGGRAVLGIGGAWFEREHDAYGIDFFSGHGERLDRLDEAVMLMRRLLDGERFSHEGRFYTFHDALVAPRPVQSHLPILVGGSGPARRCGPWRCGRTAGTPAAPSRRSARSSTSWPSTAPTSAGTWPGSRRPSASRSRSATTGRPPWPPTSAARGERHRGHGGRHGAPRLARRGRRRSPALRRARLRDRHRPDAGPVRSRDDRPDGARVGRASIGRCTSGTMVSGRAGTALKRAGRWPFLPSDWTSSARARG